MSIVTIRTFTRPDTSIPWHFEVLPSNSNFLEILKTRYMDTGKIVQRYVQFTDLVMTVNIFWSSREDYQEHINDQDLQEYFSLRDAYNQQKNITDTVEIIEV